MCYDCRLIFPTIAAMEQHTCLIERQMEDVENMMKGGGVNFPKPITSQQLKKYEEEKKEEVAKCVSKIK